MTAFVLVPDLYTGGWIWEETAAALRGSGAEVHPVTLTGMAERRQEAGTGTDLHTHVEDVLRVLDAVGHLRWCWSATVTASSRCWAPPTGGRSASPASFISTPACTAAVRRRSPW